jgi:hypothetical protein
VTRRRRIWSTVGTATVVILVTALYVVLSSREQAYDRSFDTRVASPAYAENAPLVLYDEGHLNAHTASRAYKPFADLLRHDGYEFEVVAKPFSDDVLSRAAVLVVVCARGKNDANDDPAFSTSETDVIERWVRGGGSLLLVTDHWPFGAAAESLARRFGVGMGKGMVEDPEHHDARLGESHVIFARDNGSLRDHAIIRGRRPVLTFTGQSLVAPSEAVAFLALSDAAIERPPTAPKVEKSRGDVRVTMEYADPVPIHGRAQGIALEWEKGRVVVLADAGMLRAQRERGGMRVGMNVPEYDNRQLALNIMHWLSRAI